MQNKLLNICGGVTLLFCVLISFDIFPFLRGPAPYPPDWQWEYFFINTLEKIWLPVAVIWVILIFSYYLERKTEMHIQKHESKILFCLICLFFLFQLSITFFSRAGIGVLLARIIHPDMNGYFTAAIQIHDVSSFLKTFNATVLSFPMHAQGHPPGAILFFWVIEQIFRPISFFFGFLNNISLSHSDIAQIWKGLTISQKTTALITGLFIPFLSTFTSLFVYYIGKKLYGIRVGIRAACISISIPSFIFFIPLNDVFLPLFPLSSFYCFVRGLSEEKPSLLFLSGVIFSAGLFFSISLLPLLFLFGMYLVWRREIKIIFQNGPIFFLGMLPIPLSLFLYGYNTLLVFQTLLRGLPENRAYLTWVFFNVSDFFIFLGIPLFFFFMILLCKYIGITIGLQLKKIDPLTIGTIGMITLLDVSGSVRGEVARIWLPMYPFFVLSSIFFMTKTLRIQRKGFVLILFLQFVQVLFMQEFWVMLW